MAGKLSNFSLNQRVVFAIEEMFSQICTDTAKSMFGVVCQIEMSVTRNSFAALICINIRPHRYKIFG